MAAAKLSDAAFSAILEAHPGLRDRFVSIAMAVANSEGNLKEADAIEERIVEEMRLLGREAMQGWAENEVEATESRSVSASLWIAPPLVLISRRRNEGVVVCGMTSNHPALECRTGDH